MYSLIISNSQKQIAKEHYFASNIFSQEKKKHKKKLFSLNSNQVVVGVVSISVCVLYKIIIQAVSPLSVQ